MNGREVSESESSKTKMQGVEEGVSACVAPFLFRFFRFRLLRRASDLSFVKDNQSAYVLWSCTIVYLW